MPKSEPLNKNVGGAIALFIGMIPAFFAYVLITDNIHFLNNSIETTGRVIDFDQKKYYHNYTNVYSDREDLQMYTKIVEYITEDNDTLVSLMGIQSSISTYSIGEEVDVIYRKDDPNKAQMKDFVSMWSAPFALVLIGLAFILPGLFVIFKG